MTKLTIIPSDWDEETDGWTAMIICLPNSVQWRATVAGQINALTYGFSWDRNSGNIKEAQQISNRIMESIMPDCDSLFTSISEAIVNISQAITVQTQLLQTLNINLETQISIPDCGCEGIGTVLEPDPIEEEPPVGEGTDFEDQEDYDNYKCQVATTIVFDIQSVQKHLRTYFESGYFLTGVAIIAVTIGPILEAAGLVALVATVGAVAKIVQAIATGETLDFTNMIDELDLYQHELECALFCADNAQQAQDDTWAILGDMSLNSAELEYLKLYFVFPVLNTLFFRNDNYPKFFLTADCSDCGCDDTPCDWILSPYFFTSQTITSAPATYGTGTITTDGTTFTIDSSPFTLNGVAHHGVCLIVRGATGYSDAPSDLVPGQAVPDCDALQWIQMQSSIPSGASTVAYIRNVSGNLATTGFPGNNNTQNDYHVLRWHRSNAQGGAFSIQARILNA